MHSLYHFWIVSITRVIQPRTKHLVRLLARHLASTNELSTSIDVLSAIFHILGINLHNDFSSFGYMKIKSEKTKIFYQNKKMRVADKYEHPGIYCIKINGKIVYVGKSRNMLQRIAEHYVGIKAGKEKKYRIMAEAQRKGYSIDFDVLYYATARTSSAIMEEIGEKKGEYIRQYQPVLNTQIPKAENWHKFDINKLDAA